MSWTIQSVREAAVDAGEVYRLYADPTTWGAWAHNTAWGRATGPLEAGSRVDVRVRGYPWTYRVLVRRVEPGHRLVTEVRPFGVLIVSSYQVTPTERGARLDHVITVSGPLERFYRLVEGRYTRMLARETELVVELASGRRSLGAGVAGPEAPSEA